MPDMFNNLTPHERAEALNWLDEHDLGARGSSRPSKERVKEVMDQVDDFDYPDGKHWMEIHRILGLEYGDVFEYITEDPEFFGAKEIRND